MVWTKDLYLDTGELLVRTAHRISVSFIPFDVMLTSERLILLDNEQDRIPPQVIPLSDIFSVKGGMIPTGEPVITITLQEPERPGQTVPLDLVFTQRPSERRSPERDDWLRTLMENLVDVRQEKVLSELAPPEKQGRMGSASCLRVAPEILFPIPRPTGTGGPLEREGSTAGTASSGDSGNLPPPREEPAIPVTVSEKPPLTAGLPQESSMQSGPGDQSPSPADTGRNKPEASSGIPTGCSGMISPDARDGPATDHPSPDERKLPDSPASWPESRPAVIWPVLPEYNRVDDVESPFALPEQREPEGPCTGDQPRPSEIQEAHEIHRPVVPAPSPAILFSGEPDVPETTPPAGKAPGIPDDRAAKDYAGNRSGITGNRNEREYLFQENPPAQPFRKAGMVGRKIILASVLFIVIAIIAGFIVLPQHHTTGSSPTLPAITPAVTPNTTPALPARTPPPTGLWVSVEYPQYFYGTVGNPGDLQEISGSGSHLYSVRNSEGLVQADIQKQDNTGDTLSVTIYINGTSVYSTSVRKPMGSIRFLIDPKTGRPPV